MKKRLVILIVILLPNILFAYSAKCIVKFFNSTRTTEFDIIVSNRTLTMYAEWGKYVSHYKGRKKEKYYYHSIDNNGFESNTYLGKIKSGQMSYYSIADDGYGFKGTCRIK